MIKRKLAGGMLVLAALTFSAAPSFAIQPVNDAAKVKVYDNTGELDKEYLKTLVSDLEKETGVKLHLYLVDTLDGLSGAEWAKKSLTNSKLTVAKDDGKTKNVLFVIATEDRLYGSAFSGSKKIASDIKDIENDVLEYLQNTDWNGAMEAYVNAVSMVESSPDPVADPDEEIDYGYIDNGGVTYTESKKLMTQEEKDNMAKGFLAAGGGVLALGAAGTGGYFVRRRFVVNKDYTTRMAAANSEISTLFNLDDNLKEKKDFLSLHFKELPEEVRNNVETFSKNLTDLFALSQKASEQSPKSRFAHLMEVEKEVIESKNHYAKTDTLVSDIENVIKNYDEESKKFFVNIQDNENRLNALQNKQLSFVKEKLIGDSLNGFRKNEKSINDTMTKIQRIKSSVSNSNSPEKSEQAYAIVQYNTNLKQEFSDYENKIINLYNGVLERINYLESSVNKVSTTARSEQVRIFESNNSSLRESFENWKQKVESSKKAIDGKAYDLDMIYTETYSAENIFNNEFQAQIEYERKLKEAQDNFERISRNIEYNRNNINGNLNRSGVNSYRRSSFSSYDSDYARARALAGTDIIAAYALLSTVNNNFNSLNSSIQADISSYTSSMNNNFGSSGGGFSSGSSGGSFGGGGSSSTGSSGGSF